MSYNHHQSITLSNINGLSSNLTLGSGQLGSLSIAGTQGAQVSNLSPFMNSTSGLFEESFRYRNNQYATKYEVYETTEDVLLLSTVWQRLRIRNQNLTDSAKQPPQMPSKLIDNVLFENITQEDRVRTEQIREFYSKKLMWWSLNDVKLTHFRTDLKKLIQSDGKLFKENMLPLAYRIPDFYDYDNELDVMFASHNKKVVKKLYVFEAKELNLVKVVKKINKRTKVNEYWYSDETDNLNVISVPLENQLAGLLDLHSKNSFRVKAKFDTRIQDDREFFEVKKYSFL